MPALDPPESGPTTMASAADITLTHHDELPAAETALVDRGLGAANAAVAPLHEVRSLACFARSAGGAVIGGAVGRTWGRCAELQQLWVDGPHRGRGIGRRLLREFEAAAARRDATEVFLETFSFQAPHFYRVLGYEVAYEHAVYPHGIVRMLMRRRTGPDAGGAA
jgi:ribosomal protein S18 acetylase RimI-like enzyme